MPDISDTLLQIFAVLDEARSDCAQESKTYAGSQYVYIGKSHLSQIRMLLAHGQEVASWQRSKNEEAAQLGKKHLALLEELEHISSDNDTLRRELQGQVAVLAARDAWSQKLRDTLLRLRQLFGGSPGEVTSPKGLQALLAEVDEVLSQ